MTVRLLACLALVGLIAAACGGPAAPPTPAAGGEPRVIEVTLNDQMEILPASMTARAGETIRFVVTNVGILPHEFFLGDEEAQAEHAREMAAHGMPHDEEDGVSVPAGETKELVYTFGEPGELLAACHVTGHYEAGMIATITVTE